MLTRIIEFGLQNRFFVMLLGLGILAAGIVSWGQLPVDAFPDVSPNLVQVFTVTEGLAPEEIESFVTYPVEAAMAGLPGVQAMRSVSNFGLSVVSVYFEDGMDIYFARQLVGERLGEARDRIPEGFGEPEMGPISTGMGQVLFYYLEDESGQYTLEELRSLQDWVVKFHLQTVPGVTEVLGIGGFEKQFQVNLHPENLLAYGLTVGEVLERIRDNNLNVGANFLERGGEELVVRSVGLATGLEDLGSIVVKAEGGRAVLLRDVAEIEIGGALRRGLQSRNGVEEVVAGQVIKLFGANSSAVIEQVEEKVREINLILPEGVSIVPYYEQKSLVEAAVRTVRDALWQGILLVVVVLLLFMGGLRPSLVVALSIPFSVLFAVILMSRLGVSANLMSLGGLAIAIGIIVDGAIVVVENLETRLRTVSEGDRFELLRQASLEVVRPVAFAILIITLVFLPLFTLQGVEGKTFKPLALTVTLAMAGSFVFAILLAPALSSMLLHRRGSKLKGEPGIVRALQKPYRPVLKFFVARPWTASSIALALLVVGALVLPRLGSEFTPKLREGTLVVRLTMAPSISLNESLRTTQIVERRLLKIPAVREVVTRVGRGEVGAHTDPVNSAEIFVLLHPREAWPKGEGPEDLEHQVREAVSELPGVLASLTQPIEMTVDELMEGVRAELAVKVFGEDLVELEEIANRAAGVLRGVEGATDVQVDQVAGTPQLLIRVNRAAIARYGIDVSDVQSVIRVAVGGEVAGQIFEGVRRYDIYLRYEERARDRIAAIRDILVDGPDGLRVPLDQLATLEVVEGPRQITRQNSQRFVSIQCNVIERDIVGFVEEAQARLADELELPPGVMLSWGGQYRLQQEANRRLRVVIPLTLGLVALLLFANFHSVRRSALILLNIPLALVGGIVALWVTGINLSVPATVGFIALFGIALENSMVLVERIDQLYRDEGIPIRDACVQGALRRLRPVLMTALTTGLGLSPLLFASGTGSEVQRPLATVVLGGLLTSTLVTLLVVPAVYPWFQAAKLRSKS